MAQTTAIEWTDVSWNPVHGCSKVSPGCANCYAETLSLRYGQTAKPWTPANAAENVMLKPHKLREPLSKAGPWKRPCRVFVNSMSDLFHELVPFEYIDQVFETMVAAPQHTFQILTKRPERMLAYFEHAADCMGLVLEDLVPWPNIWLGTSIENRRFVHRADVLRLVPAAVRFISAEPLLGPLVPHTAPPFDGETVHLCRSCGERKLVAWWPRPASADLPSAAPSDLLWKFCAGCRVPLNLGGIHWLIVGGESGPGHRRISAGWVRDLRDVCADTETAFFFKQWGGATPKAGGRDLDGRTWDEMPELAHA